MAINFWSTLRKTGIGVAILLVYCLVTAQTALADPDDDKWKDQIFAWLETHAKSGETRPPKMMALEATGRLIGHRFNCVQSRAFGPQVLINQQIIDSTTLSQDIYLGGVGSQIGEYLSREGRLWTGVGCFRGSCTEKTIIVADAHDGLIHFGLIHYLPWHNLSTPGPDLFRDAHLSIFPDPATPTNGLNKIADLAADVARPALSAHRPPEKLEKVSMYAFSCGG